VAPYLGVVGSGEPDQTTDLLAERIGREIAEAGAVLVCGGLGGVMAAACRGAVAAGGLTIGLLPGMSRGDANPWIEVAIPTGLGELRNGLVVRASDVLIAIGGEYGTLSEVAFALKLGRPVVGVGTWQLERPDGNLDDAVTRATAQDAVVKAIELAGRPTA
jgi:uncharacterized protein (TIGR00725 family)